MNRSCSLTRLWIVVVGVSLLTGCPAWRVSRPSSPVAAPDSQSDDGAVSSSPSPGLASAPAKINQIVRQPVSVQLANSIEELPAQVGMGLQYGESIKTGESAMAEVNLADGRGVRINAGSVVKIQPDHQVSLIQGETLVWVKPGQTSPDDLSPIQVATPAGTVSIQGTTVFISVPEDVAAAVTIFTWEGTVAVQLPNQREVLSLTSAEEVQIKATDTDLQVVRRRVRRLSRREWLQRRQASELLNGFATPIPTRAEIDGAIPPPDATARPPEPRAIATVRLRRPAVSRRLEGRSIPRSSPLPRPPETPPSPLPTPDVSVLPSASPAALPVGPSPTPVFSSLSPFQLVTLAHQGYFRGQGIPAYGDLVVAYRLRQVSARSLVEAAIRRHRLAPDQIYDRRYLNAVEAQLQGLLQR